MDTANLIHLDSPLELLRKQLEARIKWYEYQCDNKKYNVNEIGQSRKEIKEIEVAINILKEKRREFRIGSQNFLKYLSEC